MKRYRARLANGRVIGPFDLDGVEELALKKHITGKEEFQEFPTGDWAPLKKFEALYPIVLEALQSEADHDRNEATFIQKLSDLGISESSKLPEDPSGGEFPQEFNYSLDDEEEFAPETVEDEVEEIADEEESEEEQQQPTELMTRNEYRQEESLDKTVINPHTLKYLEELKLKEQEEQRKAKETAEAEADGSDEPEPGAQVDLDNDATQLVSLQELKKELQPKIMEVEDELRKEAQERSKKEAKLVEKAEQKEEAPATEEELEDDNEEAKKKAKKKRLILIAAFLLAVVFLLPDEQPEEAPKEVQVIYPTLSFPQQYDVPDEEKAKTLYEQGMVAAAKGTFLSKLEAARFFKASLENQFRNNPAAARLIFTYSELLKHADKPLQEATRVFRLIQIFSPQAMRDPNLTAAMALFYLNIGKAPAAVKTIEKFNTIKGSKPTLELFAVFLKSLMENGELVKASAVEERLMAVEKRPLFVQTSLFDYYVFKGDYESASKILVETEQENPETVSLMLRKAALLLYQEDFESLELLLRKIRFAQAGQSRIYYSKYLEYLGMLAVRQNNPDLALQAFQKALEHNESLELRSRLAALNSEDAGSAGQLINESKAVALVARSKGHWAKKNPKFAFKDALEATRIAPSYLPAQLYLAELQINQSFFDEAIKSLEKLYDEHPHNPEVVFALLNAYVRAYKFQQAQRLLSIIGGTELRGHSDYYSTTARYYIYRDEFAGSVTWLQRAINANPLDDENTYELAKMFIRYRKYDQAKILLNKAMELDPSRVDFRVSYGDIVYETDGANAAIGYLYDVLRDFPDNAKILSAIGIYYYRSGQVKMFQSTKEKLLGLPDRDTALFEFLIQAARMDEKYDDVIKYSQDLIALNPGDLRARLFLGQIYMEMSKYKEALDQFNAIKERLPTYPKLQYFMSRLYLLTDNIEMATELAKKEIAGNPTAIDGYLLLGEIYKEQKKYNEAEEQYKKAQRINAANVDVLVGLAYISFMKSQYEIALDLFKKAKNIEPGRAETHKLLGDVYRKVGQSSLAVESYKMFLELSPNSRYKQTLQNYINLMQ